MSEVMQHSNDHHHRNQFNNQHDYHTMLMEKFDINNVPVPKTIDELAAELHRVFSYDSINVDYVKKLMENWKSSPREWGKYAKYDPYKYTRNLIDKGNGKFNLILLCWGESQGSSIHDHANSHCFLKVVDGELCETLYDWPKDGCEQAEEEMVPKQKSNYKKDQVTYINDSIGLHRVENLSHSKPAASLHLYVPPFDECHTFDQKTAKMHTCKVTFFTVDGKKVKYCTQNNEIAS